MAKDTVVADSKAIPIAENELSKAELEQFFRQGGERKILKKLANMGLGEYQIWENEKQLQFHTQ